MSIKNRDLLWSMLVSFVCAIVVAISGVIYTGISNQRNNQQWCEFLTPIKQAVAATPPKNEFGEKIGKAVSNLHKNFECGEAENK